MHVQQVNQSNVGPHAHAVSCTYMSGFDKHVLLTITCVGMMAVCSYYLCLEGLTFSVFGTLMGMIFGVLFLFISNDIIEAFGGDELELGSMRGADVRLLSPPAAASDGCVCVCVCALTGQEGIVDYGRHDSTLVC
jgi:hypothetical protein